MSLGDFEFAENLGDNEYVLLINVIFLFGTVVSLLIILNMVIGIMSSTFERVKGDA